MKFKIILLGASAMMASGALAQDAEQPVETVTEVVAEATTAGDAVDTVATVPEVAPADDAVELGILPAGTAITLSMDNALATDKRKRIKGEPKPPKGQRRITNMGDSFTMTVVEDVIKDNTIIIPKGARGVGEVTMVSGRGGFGKSGKIEFKLNNIEFDGQTIAMEGTHLQKGKGRGGAAIAGTIIAGVVAGAFIKGDNADVLLQSEWTFSTVEDVEFKVTGNAVEPVVVAAEQAADEAAEAAAAAAETAEEAVMGAEEAAGEAAGDVEVAPST